MKGHPSRTVPSRGNAGLMPFFIGKPAQPPPPPPLSNPGNVASGFCGDCLPFTALATTTVAITSLDIIADWIMYQAFIDLPYTEQLQATLTNNLTNQPPSSASSSSSPSATTASNSPVLTRFKLIYLHLPLLLKIFLALGLTVYVLDLLWMCWMFSIERKKFKDKRDGLPRKDKVVEDHGSDFFIMFHILLHDLPVSALLFAAQVSISCSFIMTMYQDVYFISVLTGILSVTWKAIQIVYNSGCFGEREEYVCSSISWVLRVISSVLILLVLLVSTLNILLLKGWQMQVIEPPSFAHEMMGKINFDRWLDQESVVMVINRTDRNEQRNVSVGVVKVVGLKAIFMAGSHGYVQRSPCSDIEPIGSLISKVMSQNDSVQPENCTVVFKFRADPKTYSLYFDLYFVVHQKNDLCYSYQYEQSRPIFYDRLLTSYMQANLTHEIQNEYNVPNDNTTSLYPTTEGENSTRSRSVTELTEKGLDQLLYLHFDISNFNSLNQCKFSLVQNMSLMVQPSCLRLQ